MISNDILKEKALNLPIHYKATGVMYHPEMHLRAYEETLKKYSASETLIHKTRIFLHRIGRVYKEYLLGCHGKAYEEFKRALEGQIDGIGLITAELPRIPLYRGRVNRGNFDYKDDEMFHIPFDKRGVVSTQRFSAPGMPCLYLGSSTYLLA